MALELEADLEYVKRGYAEAATISTCYVSLVELVLTEILGRQYRLQSPPALASPDLGY